MFCDTIAEQPATPVTHPPTMSWRAPARSWSRWPRQTGTAAVQPAARSRIHQHVIVYFYRTARAARARRRHGWHRLHEAPHAGAASSASSPASNPAPRYRPSCPSCRPSCRPSACRPSCSAVVHLIALVHLVVGGFPVSSAGADSIAAARIPAHRRAVAVARSTLRAGARPSTMGAAALCIEEDKTTRRECAGN